MLSIREKKYTVYFSKTVRVHTLFNKNIVHEKVKLDILFYSVRIKNGLKIERHRLSLNHSQTMNLSIPKPKYNIPYSSEKLPRGLLKSKINHVIFTPLKRPSPHLILQEICIAWNNRTCAFIFICVVVVSVIHLCNSVITQFFIMLKKNLSQPR